MAGTKLSALTELAVEPAASDELYVNDGGVSKRIQYSTIKAVFATAAQGGLADSALQDVVDDTSPTLGGALDAGGFDINNGGVIFLTEQAAAEADVAGKGQFWVLTATPNVAMFTDDAGTDHPVFMADGTVALTAAANLGGQDLTNGGVLFLTEQAAAEADVAGKGQFWVETLTPNIPRFTDDAGTDFYIQTTPSLLLRRKSVTAGITAAVGSAQGDGPLTTEVNQISTCANAGDAVTLPTAVAGLEVTIINNGAQAADVFPASGDNLGAGVDTAASLAAGNNITYVAYDATNWFAKT